MTVFMTALVYVGAAVAEIAGSFAFWHGCGLTNRSFGYCRVLCH